MLGEAFGAHAPSLGRGLEAAEAVAAVLAMNCFSSRVLWLALARPYVAAVGLGACRDVEQSVPDALPLNALPKIRMRAVERLGRLASAVDVRWSTADRARAAR